MDNAHLNYQGIIFFDPTIEEKMKSYLDERQAHLCTLLRYSLMALGNDSFPPELRPSNIKENDLDHAIEQLKKKIDAIKSKDSTSEIEHINTQETVEKFNAALWEHVEMLEENAIELFQQLSQTLLTAWKDTLKNTIDFIYHLLIKKLESIKNILPKLNNILIDYVNTISNKSYLTSSICHFFGLEKAPIDPLIHQNIEKTEQFLNQNYKQFNNNFNAYKSIALTIEPILNHIKEYETLKTLDNKQQELFYKIFHLVRLWEANSKSNSIHQDHITSSLRYGLPIERVTHMFRRYHTLLRNRLFERSRTIKVTPRLLFTDPTGRAFILDTLNNYRNELKTLSTTVSSYHDFLLRTDPDPYVRSRLGFAESTVAAEPRRLKALHELILDNDELKKLYERFSEKFEEGPKDDDEVALLQKEYEIQHQLHQMSQPLASQSAVRGRAESILTSIEDINELGSFGPKSIEIVRATLNKLLHIDSKQLILRSIPHFESIYQMHQNIISQNEDKTHQQRLLKLKQLCQHILKKAEHEEALQYENEVLLDINDIKTYLQDFYASVQRSLSDEESGFKRLKIICDDIQQHLLEYRMLFNRFLSQLKRFPEGKFLLAQLIFIEHYFESIDNKIEEFKLAKKIP